MSKYFSKNLGVTLYPFYFLEIFAPSSITIKRYVIVLRCSCVKYNLAIYLSTVMFMTSKRLKGFIELAFC